MKDKFGMTTRQGTAIISLEEHQKQYLISSISNANFLREEIAWDSEMVSWETVTHQPFRLPLSSQLIRNLNCSVPTPSQTVPAG